MSKSILSLDKISISKLIVYYFFVYVKLNFIMETIKKFDELKSAYLLTVPLF